jgi:hypothetical protein
MTPRRHANAATSLQRIVPIALLAVMVCFGWVTYRFIERTERETERRDLETVRVLPEKSLVAVGPNTARVEMSCQGTRLKYQVRISSLDPLGFARDSLRFREIIVSFRDSIGFELFKRVLPASGFVRSIDNGGRVYALHDDAYAKCIPQVYKRIRDWHLVRR